MVRNFYCKYLEKLPSALTPSFPNNAEVQYHVVAILGRKPYEKNSSVLLWKTKWSTGTILCLISLWFCTYSCHSFLFWVAWPPKDSECGYLRSCPLSSILLYCWSNFSFSYTTYLFKCLQCSCFQLCSHC